MFRLTLILLVCMAAARHAYAQHLYWGQEEGIWRASLNGTDAGLFAKIDSPLQLRVDRTSAQIYYSRFFSPASHIARIGVRDLEHQVLLSSDSLGQGFSLDPLRQQIYFTANDSSVWRIDIATLALARVLPRYASDIAIASNSHTLYWTLRNDVLKQYSLNRRQLDSAESETVYFNFTFVPPFHLFGLMALDPFDDRLFAVNFLVYYSGYPQELFRPSLDVFDLGAEGFPTSTFYNLDEKLPPLNNRFHDMVFDPVREHLYLLLTPADEKSALVYRFEVPTCLEKMSCEPDLLPIHPTGNLGIWLGLDPCGIDVHPVLSDVVQFSNCMAGPGPESKIPRTCYCSDFDENLLTDLRDLAILQNLFLVP